MLLLALVVAVVLSAYALLVMALCRIAAQSDIALGMKQEVGERKTGRRSRRAASRVVGLDGQSALSRRGASGALLTPGITPSGRPLKVLPVNVQVALRNRGTPTAFCESRPPVRHGVRFGPIRRSQVEVGQRGRNRHQ